MCQQDNARISFTLLYVAYEYYINCESDKNPVTNIVAI